jgi:hypothetical protein
MTRGGTSALHPSLINEEVSANYTNYANYNPFNPRSLPLLTANCSLLIGGFATPARPSCDRILADSKVTVDRQQSYC